MVSIDSIVLQFLDGNGLTVIAVYSVLMGLAKYSKWTWDEKIMEIFGGALEVFKFKREK